MSTATKHRGVKWFILYVGGDLLLVAVCAIVYFCVTSEPDAEVEVECDQTTFEAELAKAQKEAMQHTGK